MNITKNLLGIVLVLAIGFSSCKKDDEITELQLAFVFNHTVDAQALEFDTIKYTNAFGNKYSVSTLKYFVSDITLHNNDGSQILFGGIFYLDARDNSTLSFVSTNKIPVGNYTKLSFTYGIDSASNITGIFTNQPESLMEWPIAMGGGYHYMKLEGKFDSTGVIKNYQAHTGPTMGDDYSFEVSLTDAAFNCACESITIDINMDINKWWVDPNTIDLNDMSMIMGNKDKQVLLQANGANVFTASTSN